MFEYYFSCNKFSNNKLIKRCLDIATAQAFPSCPIIKDLSDVNGYFPKYLSFFHFVSTCYRYFILYGDCLIYSYKKNNKINFQCLNPESFFIENDVFFYFDKNKACRKISSNNLFFISNNQNNKNLRGSGSFDFALKYEKYLNRINEIELKKSLENSKLFISKINNQSQEDSITIGEEKEKNESYIKTQVEDDMKIIDLGCNQEMKIHEVSVEQQKYRNSQIIKQICLFLGVDYFLVTGDSTNIVERTYKTYHETNSQIIKQNLQLYFEPMLQFIGRKAGIENPVIEFEELAKQNMFMHLRCEFMKKKIELLGKEKD